MKKFITAVIFLFFLLPFITFGQDKIKFTTGGVTCSMCSRAIHESLSNDKFIQKIKPNLKTQEWDLEYKKDEFQFKNLKKRVDDAGFSIITLYFNGKLIFGNDRNKKN